MAKVYVVGLDGSNIGYQALRLAAMIMNPEEDKIEVLHICLPGDDGELATRLAHNAEIELRCFADRRNMFLDSITFSCFCLSEQIFSGVCLISLSLRFFFC